MTPDEAEALFNEVQRTLNFDDLKGFKNSVLAKEDLRALLSLARRSASVDRLREALRPFVEDANRMDEWGAHANNGWRLSGTVSGAHSNLTFGDLRRAREAYDSLDPQPTGFSGDWPQMEGRADSPPPVQGGEWPDDAAVERAAMSIARAYERNDDPDWRAWGDIARAALIAASPPPSRVEVLEKALKVATEALQAIYDVGDGWGGRGTCGDGHARCREHAYAALTRLKDSDHG